jgi:hypothetical protein
VQFTVGEDARCIEVKTKDEAGELPLASYMIVHSELSSGTTVKKYSVTLEGGQKLFFGVSPSIDSDGEFTRALIDFTYQDASSFKAALSSLQSLFTWTFEQRLRTVAFALILIVVLAGISLYVSKKDSPPQESQQASSNTHSDAVAPSADAQSIQPPDQAPVIPAPEVRLELPKRAQRRSAARDSNVLSNQNQSLAARENANLSRQDQVGSEDTRGLTTDRNRRALLSVRRIYVEQHSGDSSIQLIREVLIQALEQSTRYSVAASPQDVDALLLWSVKERNGTTQIQAWLVTSTNKSLWASTDTISSKTFQEHTAEVTQRIIQKLLDYVAAVEGRQ